jgi:hypothetical protein
MGTKLVFESTQEGVSYSELSCFATGDNELYMEITSENDYPQWITLDRETAIKLVKKLKTEISKLT